MQEHASDIDDSTEAGAKRMSTIPNQPEESGEEIVVTARRRSGDAPAPHVSLSISTGGGQDFNDLFPQELRALFVDETDFDLDGLFTAKEKEIIVQAIRRIAAHPNFAEHFANLAKKGADINIRLVSRADQIPSGEEAALYGLNSDFTVAKGAKLTIFLRRTFNGATVTPFQLAVSAVHELIHALGVPSLTAQLDASGSDWDRLTTIDLFRGYDFNASPQTGSLTSDFKLASQSGGTLMGGPSYEIFAGSNNADTIIPGGGRSLTYPGLGDDNVQLDLGGAVDVIRDDGGFDHLTMPNGVSVGRVGTRWTQNGRDLAILIDGQPEAIIENAAGSGAIEQVDVAGQTFSVAALQTSVDIPLADETRNAEFFGAFAGGVLASANQGDPEGAVVTYRLASVEGAYADQQWSIDPATGAVHGHFYKDDRSGSEFTFINVIASDQISSARILISLRWATQGEVSPEF